MRLNPAEMRNNFELLLAANARLASIAWAVRQSGNLHATTNLWVTAENHRWFCFLNTTTSVVNDLTKVGEAHSHRSSLTNVITELRAYPEAFLERALAQALRNTKPPIPGYFDLTAELAGEKLNLQPDPSGSAARSGCLPKCRSPCCCR